MTHLIKYTALLLFCFPISMSAGIYCPNDIVLECNDDIYNTAVTGVPTLLGSDVWAHAEYFDVENLNACNVGFVYRTWFADKNGNAALDAGENFCQQVITLHDITQPVQVFFPPDVTYTCVDDIGFTPPTWYGGPCDLIGYDYDEMTFEFVEDACYKILRTFTVINWCDYVPNDPQTGGFYQHTQVIKVVDNQPPTLTCSDVIYNVNDYGDEDGDSNFCEARGITLSNSAEDSGNCPGGNIKWVVEIDLWGDGTTDYQFSSFLPTFSPYYIEATATGEEVEVMIPEDIPSGSYAHKVHWQAYDGCANVVSCSNTFSIEDQKAPTPYCHLFLSSTINPQMGMVEIPADLFNAGAYDNCSDSEDLIFSFSSDVTDDVKVIDCESFGFQFFKIYVTDESGNQDFCEVFMIVFDNGSCGFRISPVGTTTTINGSPLTAVNVKVMDGEETIHMQSSDENGNFILQDIEAYQHFEITVDPMIATSEEIDVSDLIGMLKHLMGVETFPKLWQHIASDVNGDQKVSAADLIEMRDLILGRISEFSGTNGWKFIPSEELMTLDDINEVNNRIAMTQYSGSLDFTGILIGDIDGSASHMVDTETNIRQNAELELGTPIQDASERLIPIIATEDITIDALKLNLNVTIEGVKSGLLSLDAQDFANHDRETRILALDLNRSISRGDVLFYLVTDHDVDEIVRTNYDATLFASDGLSYNLDFVIRRDPDKPGLNVFPNPFKNHITFTSDASLISAELWDISGKLIQQQSYDGITEKQGRMTLEESLLPGVYILKIQTISGTSSHKLSK